MLTQLGEILDLEPTDRLIINPNQRMQELFNRYQIRSDEAKQKALSSLTTLARQIEADLYEADGAQKRSDTSRLKPRSIT